MSFLKEWISCREYCKLVQSFCNTEDEKKLKCIIDVQHQQVNPCRHLLKIASSLTGVIIQKVIINISEYYLHELWNYLMMFEHRGEFFGVTWFHPSLSINHFLSNLVLTNVNQDFCISSVPIHETATALKKSNICEFKTQYQFGTVVNERFLGWTVRLLCDTNHSATRSEIYQGEISGTLPHGRGTIRQADGTVYSGYWHYGKKEGKGTLVSPAYWIIGVDNYSFTRINGIWHNNELLKDSLIEETETFPSTALARTRREIVVDEICGYISHDVDCFRAQYKCYPPWWSSS